jgi:hypothetical protein
MVSSFTCTMVFPFIKLPIIAALVLALGSSLSAQSFKAGQQYDTVKCLANQHQSYTL